jgi:hypothetical protein
MSLPQDPIQLVTYLIRVGYTHSDFESVKEISGDLIIAHKARGGVFQLDLKNISKTQLLDTYLQLTRKN